MSFQPPAILKHLSLSPRVRSRLFLHLSSFLSPPLFLFHPFLKISSSSLRVFPPQLSSTFCRVLRVVFLCLPQHHDWTRIVSLFRELTKGIRSVSRAPGIWWNKNNLWTCQSRSAVCGRCLVLILFLLFSTNKRNTDTFINKKCWVSFCHSH